MNDSGSKEESSAEGDGQTTPGTEKKEKEEGRRNEGEEEEEDPDANEYDGGDGSAKENVEPSIKMLFEYAKKNRGRFAEVMKSENLENSPPSWDEEERKEEEKECVKKLLSEMKVQSEELVVNHEDTHTVTFVYDEKQESFELSISGFVEEFLEKVKAYGSERGRMSPLLPEQSECFLKILIECQRFEDVECAIDGIDDSFGSANTMNRLLSLMEELVKEQRCISDPIVKFSDQSTIDLMKAFEFMKVFKDTRDSNARKYCCILMFLILTTDIYIENMRRANWVESLKKKKIYIEKTIELGEGSSRKYSKVSLRSELDLLDDMLGEPNLRENNALFDKIANVFGFVFNTAKVFHLISEVYDAFYKNDEEMKKAKVKFLTKLLGEVSGKCMDKANEKALAGNVNASSTTYDFRRNTNVVVIVPLKKFNEIFFSQEEDGGGLGGGDGGGLGGGDGGGLGGGDGGGLGGGDGGGNGGGLGGGDGGGLGGGDGGGLGGGLGGGSGGESTEDTCTFDSEQIRYLWKFVLSTVGPSETFLSDQLLFDMAFSCRGLRVEKKEVYDGTNADERRKIEKRERKTDRGQDMWLKFAQMFYNLAHVNASFPPASGSDRPGRAVVFNLGNSVPYVFSKNTNGRGERKQKRDEDSEMKREDKAIEEEEDDVEILWEVIIITEDNEEENQQQLLQEKKGEDRETREERNEECEEVARTQRHYYLKRFFLSQLEENGGSTYVAHAMHGMRVTGILRSAFGETREWGNGTKRGEQTLKYLQTFMEKMLEQMKKYYVKIQTKLEEKRN